MNLDPGELVRIECPGDRDGDSVTKEGADKEGLDDV